LQADAIVGAGTFTFNISLFAVNPTTNNPTGSPLATTASSASLTSTPSYKTVALDPSKYVLAANTSYRLAVTSASSAFWWQEVGTGVGCSSSNPTGTNVTFLSTSLTTNSGSSW
jgi:hypothetical protein